MAILKLTLVILEPGVGDAVNLRFRQIESKVLLLELPFAKRLETAWLKYSVLYFRERQFLERHIRKDRINWLVTLSCFGLGVGGQGGQGWGGGLAAVRQ